MSTEFSFTRGFISQVLAQFVDTYNQILPYYRFITV